MSIYLTPIPLLAGERLGAGGEGWHGAGKGPSRGISHSGMPTEWGLVQSQLGEAAGEREAG